MTKGTCTIPDCNRSQHGRGYCATHLKHLQAFGDPLAGEFRPHRFSDLETRFWLKVEKTETCWNWTAGKRNGYGRIQARKGVKLSAHRYSYELLVGPIPEGYILDHRCHNKACVRPEHLRLVTIKQNQEHRRAPRVDNTSGFLGVTFDRKVGRWRAGVMHHGERHYLGMFDTAEQAARAVRNKRNELFTHNDYDRLEEETA